MAHLQSRDRVELSYEDEPSTAISATIDRLLNRHDEGTSAEIEDYTAMWIEIIVDELNETDARQVVLLGSDLKYRLNGRL